MSTEVDELSSFITRLVTIYLDIARDGGGLVDAIAGVLTPMGYTVTTNEHYVDLVQVVKNLGKSVPKEPVLFSTFITSEEILDWEMYKEEIRGALVDEAYGRWVAEDRGKALGYAGCWTGFVKAQPGGYSVRIEVESDGTSPETMVAASIHPASLDRCRELVADLESIGQAVDALGVDEWPVIAHLDGQRSTAMNDLAYEMLALLETNNLIGDGSA